MADTNEFATAAGIPPSMLADAEIKAAFLRKLNAEAARSEAEAEACRRESDANTWRLKGEADRLNAERAQLDAERAKLVVEIDESLITHAIHKREEQERLAEHKYHSLYHFTSDVSESSVSSAMKQFDQWRRIGTAQGLAPQDIPINIIFTSPGGSVLSGLVLFDYLQEARRAGHPVTTGTYGYAASMAGLLLQAGDTRWCGKEAWVLIHQISAMSLGKIPEMEDTIQWLKRIQERVIDIFAGRALALNAAGKEVGPIETEKAAKDKVGAILHKWESLAEAQEFVRRHWERKDWWLSSEECLALGFVDEIR